MKRPTGAERLRTSLAFFEELLELEPAVRAEALAERCPDDPEMHAEVAALLEIHAREDSLAPANVSPLLPDEVEFPAGARFGDFEILKRLATGGMGCVYEARQGEPRRIVALKALRRGFDSDALRSRFHYEVEVLGRLRHPGIAQIYGAGVVVEETALGSQDTPWFAMELVDGARSLIEFAEQRGLSRRARIEIFLHVADAVNHGHQRGIIHRDLKPSNLLVNRDGRPMVIDYGIARAVGSDFNTTRLQTAPGELIGTLPYMSPEQVGNDPDAVDVRSDVYSLGVVLYELLLGRRPYELATMPLDAAIQVIRDRTPARPRRIDAGFDRDLEAVVMRALEKEPDRRYLTAGEFSDDLRRWLKHETVIAAPPSTARQLRMLARRHRALTIALAVGCGALLVATLVSIRFGLDAAAAATREKAQHAAAVTARDAESAARERATRRLEEVMHFADALRIGELIEEADDLWPCWPDRVPTMRAWIAEARGFTARRHLHEQALANLRSVTEVGTLQGRWSVRTGEDLLQVLARLEPIIVDVEGRAERAGDLWGDTIGDYQDEWDVAIESIRASEHYGGLWLQPQVGLVPLYEDLDSGLWEFWCMETGALPEPAEAGLTIDGETGVVLVLIPGGSFLMGAQALDRTGRGYDPDAETVATPPHEVELDAFFMSKYELTQGQYLRLTGDRPSLHQLGGAVPADDSHPVERVSLAVCIAALSHVALAVPTEAQWEHAARGGTTTRWWCGATPESIGRASAGNVLDATAKTYPQTRGWGIHESFDDGFVIHAPVGRLAPNAFGLHDVIGNVWELCCDVFAPYPLEHRQGDGLALVTLEEGVKPSHSVRGGSYNNPALSARVTNRNDHAADATLLNVGVRPSRPLFP